jgi:hypothetical protein
MYAKGAAISHPEFVEQYTRAREIQAEYFADEICDIFDNPPDVTSDHVQHARLRMDARKWLMSKMLPKKYGDRVELAHSGSIDFADKLAKARDRTKPSE